MAERTLGIVGGSGLYDLPGLEDVERVSLETPFGEPSDSFVVGRLEETRVVFISRHGRGHRLMPSEINYRANVWGLKKLGCERVISVTAVGSMREDVAPGDMLIVDQFFDRTRGRPSTFFGDGLVAHVVLADPVCDDLGSVIETAARETGAGVHRGGTYLCIEGPCFSTRAESRIFRQWGVDVIGMTNLPEARLAREAELCYGVLAMVTDFDCWHDTEEDVCTQGVLAVMGRNVERAKKIVRDVAAGLPAGRGCSCGSALDGAIITHPSAISGEARERLDLLVGRYLEEESSTAAG